MQLEIVTPDKQVYKGDITSASFPGIDGSFGILHRHAPMVAVLKKGNIKLVEVNSKDEQFFEVDGGVLEVKHDKIIVLAE
jgi:F-type H+-transporting ATPase subunit epsilon